MVERCVRCDINGDEVRLFDAIYEGRMTNICERCSIIENIPIIKKPDSSQLKDSEQGIGVYSRMKKLSGIKDEKAEETFFIEDKLKELNKNPQLEVPQKDKLNLVEHFHWDIMKNRRRKGFSQKQLAESLGESEIVIQMLEKAELPENAEQIIKKLEQFFQVKLKKISETEKFLQSHEEKEPILLDNKGRELEEIREPKILESQPSLDREESEESIGEFLENAEPETEIEEFGEHEIRELNEEKAEDGVERDLRGVDMEKGEFDITKANLGEVRISDLKELNRRKIEATKKEQIEEQKKIEERSSIIEARKEELRLMKEQESKELDRILGGTELLDVGKTTKPIEDSDKVEEFDEELV